MRIKHQLFAASLGMFVFFGAVSYVSIGSYQKQEPILRAFEAKLDAYHNQNNRLLVAAKDLRTDVIQVQQWLTDISATRGWDGLNDGFDEASAHASDFYDTLEKAKAIAQAADFRDIQAVLDEMERAFPPYFETGKRMAQAYVENGPAGGNPMMEDFDAVAARISEQSEHLVAIVDAKNEAEMVQLEQGIASVRTANDQSKMFIITLSSIGIGVAVLVSIFMQWMFKRNFSRLEGDLKDIENGVLDQPPHLDETAKNEFGHVGRVLNHVKQSLLRMKVLEEEQRQANVRAENERVRAAEEQRQAQIRAETEKREATHELADRFEAKVRGIIRSVADAATELYQNSQSMTGTIKIAKERASSVSLASNETSGNVQKVAVATEEMSTTAREIAQQINHSASIVRSAVTEMDNADQTSNQLDQAIGHIGEIVDFIQDLTEQINLLALNATIESARAGESGKGFAVVASEVKQLAQQASRATDEIGGSVANIKGAAERVIAGIGSVKGTIHQVHEISVNISAAVEEQTVVTNEIASNMNRASTFTRQIDQDIGEVNRSSEDANTSAQLTLEAAKILSTHSENLSHEIDTFLAEVRSDAKPEVKRVTLTV